MQNWKSSYIKNFFRFLGKHFILPFRYGNIAKNSETKSSRRSSDFT